MSNIAATTTTEAPKAQINGADTAWVLVSTALVMIMTPGVGYYYGGIASRKNKLSLLMSSALALGVVSFQWFFWGFSLTFSVTGSSFIGNLDNFALIGVGNDPHPLAPTIPGNAFMLFQCMFAVITPSLAFGSAAERTTLPVYLIFLFCWSTLVYDFIAYWTWAENGWFHTIGALDFAGGTPVHIASGFSALAYALAIGPRRTVNFKKLKSADISDVYLGTALLWFGWFGFNGGSAVAINSRAVNAIVITNLSAAVGGLTWMLLEMIIHRTLKMSLNGFCAGAIAGLVCITPASGYTSPHFSLIFGFLAGIVCFGATYVKRLTRYKYDDACDVFAVHGVGGMLGNFLTGIFAQKSVSSMSGDAPIAGGWVDQNYIQICYQLLTMAAAPAWSFVMTYLLLQIIGLIPFLKLRLSEKEEEIGTDLIEMGEAAYGHDIPNIEEEKIDEIRNESEKETNLDIIRDYFKSSKADEANYSENNENNQEYIPNDQYYPQQYNNDYSPGYYDNNSYNNNSPYYNNQYYNPAFNNFNTYQQ